MTRDDVGEDRRSMKYFASIVPRLRAAAARRRDPAVDRHGPSRRRVLKTVDDDAVVAAEPEDHLRPLLLLPRTTRGSPRCRPRRR